MVADLYPEAGSSVGSNPFSKVFISMNNELYFIGTLDNNLGQELYKITESPLPVVWVAVDIDCKDGKPRLYWKTATERNTKDFIVQASSDALNWINADTIKASGSSSASVSYQYTEKQAVPNRRFYRILQRDVDGRVSYSIIKSIACENAELKVSLFPNPASQTITLSGIEEKEIKQIEILDVTGKRIRIPGIQNNKIKLGDLAKGMYFLQIIKRNTEKIRLSFIKE